MCVDVFLSSLNLVLVYKLHKSIENLCNIFTPPYLLRKFNSLGAWTDNKSLKSQADHPFWNKRKLINCKKCQQVCRYFEQPSYQIVTFSKAKKGYTHGGLALIVCEKYSHRESNPDQRFRKPTFYPFNYGSESASAAALCGCAKINILLFRPK